MLCGPTSAWQPQELIVFGRRKVCCMPTADNSLWLTVWFMKHHSRIERAKSYKPILPTAFLNKHRLIGTLNARIRPVVAEIRGNDTAFLIPTEQGRLPRQFGSWNGGIAKLRL